VIASAKHWPASHAGFVPVQVQHALSHARCEGRMTDKLRQLEAIGFVVAGHWTLAGDALTLELASAHATARNVLYAFVADRQLMYLGKTVRTLANRMAGYCKPGPSQSTNIKNNNNIRACLQKGNVVEIYVLPDAGLLHYGGFHVNLAAGLEDSLVLTLEPPWNGGRKETSSENFAPPDATPSG